MNATNGEKTNQVKVREAGAVVPLMSLLEDEAAAEAEGAADPEMQSRAAWCLANIAGDAIAASQLGGGRTGYRPLLLLLASGNAALQRPAAACLLNASINDGTSPANLLSAGALPTLTQSLGYAVEGAHTDIVAWAAGALLNMAHARGGLEYDAVAEDGPKLLHALLGCVSASADEALALQVANAAG